LDGIVANSHAFRVYYTLFCLFTHAVFFTHRVHAFQDFIRDYTHFRKNKFTVFICTAILGIFPSLPRSRFTNGFFCTCQVSLWVVFTIPLTKSFWGKCPVVGRGQFLDWQLHPLSLMQKGNDISVPIKKIGNRSLSG
jgi:hypothetical protein